MSPAALSLNPTTLQIGGHAGWIDITDPELQLLKAFVSAPAQRLATPVALKVVGKLPDITAKRALEVQIVRLRKKLLAAGADHPTIKAIRGTGYQLCVPLHLHAHAAWTI